MTSTAEPTRFAEDLLLALTSGQFPLGGTCAPVPGDKKGPSGPATRPFGLRKLREMAEPKASRYRYCHERQMAVAADGTGGLMIEHMKLEWTTVTNNDGDEGPSEDYDWENIKGCAS